MIFLIFALAIFFAMNMGGASFAACFATTYGSKILRAKISIIFFISCVILGSVLFGKNVSVTLGKDVIPSELISQKSLFVIFLSAGFSMFISNMMKIPQSTSLVTVAAIAGVGGYFGQLNVKTISYFIPFWIILPLLSFGLTLVLGSFIYPPRSQNFWIYERFVNQRNKLRNFVIFASCYNAFSVGTNNVANVVGPLLAWGQSPWSGNPWSISSILLYLFVFAYFYGLGSIVFTGPLKTAGEQIVPLGLLSASMISMVSGTLIIIASICGVPQSFVMLQMGAIFAISSLKQGHEVTFSSDIARKALYTWSINPVITYFVSMGLCWVIFH